MKLYDLCTLSAEYDTAKSIEIVAMYRHPDGALGFANAVPANFGYINKYKDFNVDYFEVHGDKLTVAVYPDGLDKDKGVW